MIFIYIIVLLVCVTILVDIRDFVTFSERTNCSLIVLIVDLSDYRMSAHTLYSPTSMIVSCLLIETYLELILWASFLPDGPWEGCAGVECGGDRDGATDLKVARRLSLTFCILYLQP